MRRLADLTVYPDRWCITPSFPETQVTLSYAANNGCYGVLVAQSLPGLPLKLANSRMFTVKPESDLFSLADTFFPSQVLALKAIGLGYLPSNASCQVAIDVAYNVPQNWIDLTLNPGWAAFGDPIAPPQYLRDGQIVYLRGGVKNLSSSDLTFSTLPADCWPSYAQEFPVSSFDGSQVLIGNIIINPDGSLQYGLLGSGVYLGLDGIVFHL